MIGQYSCNMPAEISPDKLAELRSLGGDELISKLLGKFVENSARLINEAVTSAATGNADKVDYCVHTLKGSAMSLGLGEMSAILIPLNVRTKAKDLSGAAEDLEKLKQLLREVETYKARYFP